MDIYEKLKETPPEKLTPDELSKAIKEDIRCVLFVPEGMLVEGMPKLSKQEIYDIRKVADLFFLDKTFPVLRSNCTEAVAQAAVLADAFFLKNVPNEVLSDEFIIKVLQKEGQAIAFVDQERRTPEMYMTALENSGLALVHFPPEMITPEIAMKAVEKNGAALEYVPEELKTQELCRFALNNSSNGNCKNFEVIEHVPFSNVCMEYLKNVEQKNGNIFMVFSGIKPEIITPEIAQFAVRLDPVCFMFVPYSLKTSEICMMAVEKDWRNMRFVPEYRRTKQLCETAMMRSIHAQQFVPSRYKSPEMYMYPVKANGLNLEYVPEKFRTDEVCLQAVKSDPNAVDFVPQKAALKDITLSYDNKTNSINAKAHDDKPETKQTQREERQQTKRKGVKM